MKEPKFKEGEWCFCEFVLQQVQETKDNRITSVSDGMFSLGSNDLSDRCYPLTMRIKRISDTVKHWSNEFHKLHHNNLNHPDLNRELIRRWVEMCEESDDKKLQELYDSLSEFGNSVIRKINDLRYEQIEGINLFR